VTVGGETKLSLRYAYDGESKLVSVTDEKGNQVVGYSYDMDGNLSERNRAREQHDYYYTMITRTTLRQ